MPSLDQLLAAPARSEQDTLLVEGELVRRGAKSYVRVGGSAALWGPLSGADGYAPEATVLVGISQDGAYWVVAPSSASSGGDGGGGNIDGGTPSSVYGGTPVIDGNGVVVP